MQDQENKNQTAYFGAGCFWGVEEEFSNLPGVIKTETGYAGGHTENPTYEQVCSDKTGHAEVVKVVFDPEQISYKELLQKFWKMHDPTLVNRQGPDVGSQYRSIILAENEMQSKEAEESKKECQKNGAYDNPIATEIVPLKKFYKAEEYHQKYLSKKGLRSCHI